MSIQVVDISPIGGPDADDLRSIGYRQELHRRVHLPVVAPPGW